MPNTFVLSRSVTLISVLAGLVYAQGVAAQPAMEIHSLVGLCLDVENASGEAGAGTTVWQCHDESNQRFHLDWIDETWFALRAAHSGYCLDVEDGSLDAGAKVLQWRCHYEDNQLWQLVKVRDGAYAIVARRSGLCLDVEGPADWQAGANVNQWPCHYQSNQLWLPAF